MGQSLTGDALVLYLSLPDPGCTIAQRTCSPEPNPAFPKAHEHIRTAVADGICIQVHMRRPEKARLLMNPLLEKFGYAIDSLKVLLPEPQ
jgi:hypothetical protein